jgi:hypothetical protein
MKKKHGVGTRKEDWSNTPEAIADWLKWFESLPKLTITPEEEAETEAWLKKMDAHGLAKMGRESEDARRRCLD